MPIRVLVASVVLSFCAPSLASAQQSAPPRPPPLTATEAEGHCLTPRQAWYQLLHWLQQGERWDAARAAACLDAPPEQAAELAVQLKKVLDARGLWVPVEAMPTDPTWRNADGLPSYTVYQQELGGIAVVLRDNRWLFSAGTLERVPDLYRTMVPSGIEGLARSLPAPLRAYVAGVQVWQLIGVALLLLVAFTAQKLVLWLLANHIRRAVARIGTGWVSKTLRRIDRPLGTLAMAAVLRLGLPLLSFPIAAARVAVIATTVLAAIGAVWLAYRLIDVLTDFLEAKAAATATKLDDQLVPLVSRTLKVFVAVIGGMFILQNFDVDVGSLLAGLGLGGLAFALAAKDTIANFFGSLTIFVDKPFQIGDWVIIGGFEGTVEEVGFRTTRIRTFYNSLLTVPNSTIAATTVDNYGARKYRRYKTILRVGYDTPPEKVQELLEAIRAAILALPGMRKDYFMVEVNDYGQFALEVLLYCFMETPTWTEELRVRTELNLEILRIYRRLGIAIPFPTQTLHVAAAGEAAPEMPMRPATTAKGSTRISAD
jgi:MscS family membrane protein